MGLRTSPSGPTGDDLHQSESRRADGPSGPRTGPGAPLVDGLCWRPRYGVTGREDGSDLKATDSTGRGEAAPSREGTSLALRLSAADR